MRSIPHQPQMHGPGRAGGFARVTCPIHAPAAGQDRQHGLAVGSVETSKGLPLCGVTLPGHGPSQSLDVSSLDRLGRALRRPALFSFLAAPETSNSLLAGGRSRMDGCALVRQTGLGTVAIIIVSRQSILPATYRAAGVISSPSKRGRAVSASLLTARHNHTGAVIRCPVSSQTRDHLTRQSAYRSPRPVHASRSPSGPVADTSNLTRGEKHDVPRNRAFGT